jgi:tetratricopeptide repeat protein 30
LLHAETIVLANLCVCYIVSKQQLKAEQLIAELERQQCQTGEPQHSLHLCIINLVIGTLYCSKGNFDFGIRLIIKSLDPFGEKLGTDTWFYTKRCLLALIEKIIDGSYVLQESLYAHIIIFLDEAYNAGKQITTAIFSQQQAQQATESS